MGHRAPHRPWGATVLAAALLLSLPPPSRGQAPPFAIRQDPRLAREGGDVSLALDPPPAGVVSCSWHRAPAADVAFEILSFFARPPLGQQEGPAHTGREAAAPDCSLRIAPLRRADAGVYTVALRQPAVTTASIALTVYVLLTQPAVTPGEVTVTENDTVALTCHSPPGAQAVAWLRDGAPVSPGARLSLSPDNGTLTLRPARRGDAGAYACQASNAISANRSDDTNVTVLYGPDGVTVSPPGPLRLPLGSLLELRCAAAAAPPPLFAWARGNASLATGSHLRLRFGARGQAGEYRCRATNPALRRDAEAAVLLLLQEGGGVSSGAVAGVAVGALLGLGLLAAAAFLLWRHLGRSPPPAGPDGAKPSAPPREAMAADGVGGTEEVKYSTLTFSAVGGPGPHNPPRPESGAVVYSEVRRK